MDTFPADFTGRVLGGLKEDCALSTLRARIVEQAKSLAMKGEHECVVTVQHLDGSAINHLLKELCQRFGFVYWWNPAHNGWNRADTYTDYSGCITDKIKFMF
jgi:hypothetical protein